MNNLILKSQFHIPTHFNLTSKPQPTKTHPRFTLPNRPILFKSQKVTPTTQPIKSYPINKLDKITSLNENSRFVVVGAVTLGLMVVLMGCDDHQKALAFMPEGPLMEDFWDNMRRYGLYALTVSTGVLYAVFQPLYELLKNPISAILVITILGGGFFIVSQVVSAMIGVTDFSYELNY